MELTGLIAHHFLLSLALGMVLFSVLVSTELTGAGFYKVVVGISGSSVFFSWGLFLYSGSTLFSVSSVLSAIVIFISVFEYTQHEDKRSSLIWALFVIKLLALFYLCFEFMSKDWFQYLFFVSSMGLLGSITYTMVLGHWYLVTPKLTEKPLAYGLMAMWVILVIKIVWTGLGYLDQQQFFEVNTQVGSGYMFNWLMLSMRVLWGYLIIAVMSYFAWRLVRMRSLQSATGVLYVMTFFVFIGEVISNYLFFNYGLYL